MPKNQASVNPSPQQDQDRGSAPVKAGSGDRQEQKEIMQPEITKEDRTIQALRSEIEGRDRKILSLTRRKTDLDTKNTILQEGKEAAEAKCADLLRQKKGLESKHNELGAENKQLTNEKGRLENENRRLEEKNKKLEDENTQLDSLKSELKWNLETEEKENSALRYVLQQKSEEIQRLETVIRGSSQPSVSIDHNKLTEYKSGAPSPSQKDSGGGGDAVIALSSMVELEDIAGDPLSNMREAIFPHLERLGLKLTGSKVNRSELFGQKKNIFEVRVKKATIDDRLFAHWRSPRDCIITYLSHEFYDHNDLTHSGGLPFPRLLNKHPDEIIHCLHELRAGEGGIISVLRSGDDCFKLESNHARHKQNRVIDFMVGATSLVEAFATGSVLLSQLTHNHDIPVKIEWVDQPALFSFLALIVGIPKMFHCYEELTHFREQYKLVGSDAFFDPSLAPLDKALYVFFTSITAFLHSFIIGTSIYIGTESLPASLVVSIFSGLQFVIIEGAALAKEYNRPFFELESELIAKRKYSKSFSWFIAALTNATCFLGSTALSCLAAHEMEHVLNKHTLKHILTFECSLLFLLYNFCLMGSHIKKFIYSSLMKQDHRANNSITSNSTFNKILRYLGVSLTSILACSSLFLSTIAAQVGEDEMLKISKRGDTTLKVFSYIFAFCFGVMTMSVQGLPLVNYCRGKHHAEIGHRKVTEKKVYSIKRVIHDFATALTLITPNVIKMLTVGVKDNPLGIDLVFSGASGVMFVALYLLKTLSKHNRTPVPFRCCDLTFLSNSKYDYIKANGEPSFKDLDKNNESVYLYEEDGDFWYAVRERSLGDRFINSQLQLDEYEHKEFKSEFDKHESKAKIEAECIAESIQGQVETNIFWKRPNVPKVLMYGVLCMCASFTASLITDSLIKSPDHKNTNFLINSIGLVMFGIVGVLFMKSATHPVGRQNRRVYIPRKFIITREETQNRHSSGEHKGVEEGKSLLSLSSS